MANQNQTVDAIKTPVGRLVYGSLYDQVTTDYKNEPLKDPKYKFGVAIPKSLEGHWNQTEWGKRIWDIGHRDFPNGQTQILTFAWKITDGDSQIPNKNNIKPCDKEGYPGHWVLNFYNQFAPTLCDASDMRSIKLLTHAGFINCGDFVEMALTCVGNDQPTTPGVYLNPQAVAFRAYGARIVPSFKIDVNAIGFGQSTLPQGASLTPPASNMQVSISPLTVVSSENTVQPHYEILQAPPPPELSSKMMTPAASHSYEQYIAAGWTDQKLIQHGYLHP